jgi:ABC-type phosphate transport system substrate-binding protein
LILWCDCSHQTREWNGNEATTDFSGYKYRCINSTRKVIQIEVAIDGLSITMASNGTAADCVRSMGGLSTEQLRWIYSSYMVKELVATDWNLTVLPGNDGDDTTHLWSELSLDCAAEEIKIAGPDETSGTYEFFRETILVDYKNGGSFGGGTVGYFNSASDEEIVAYVESDSTVIGYFGYAYYIQEGSRLFAAPIQNYNGDFVPPDEASIANATYFPFSRRLFMNLLDDPKSLVNTGPFVEFGMSDEGTELVQGTGYVPIPLALRELMIRRVQESSNETNVPMNETQVPMGNESAIPTNETLSPMANETLPPNTTVVVGPNNGNVTNTTDTNDTTSTSPVAEDKAPTRATMAPTTRSRDNAPIASSAMALSGKGQLVPLLLVHAAATAVVAAAILFL